MLDAFECGGWGDRGPRSGDRPHHRRGEVAKRPGRVLVVFAALGLVPALKAQTSADTAGIRATALDYVEGWYAGDGGRFAPAVANAVFALTGVRIWRVPMGEAMKRTGT